MKLFSRNLELKLLKTLTKNSAGKIHAATFGSVKLDAFHSKAGKEIFKRIKNQMREKGYIPLWDELLYDPALSEDTRETIKDFKRKAIKGIENVEKHVSNLLKYRKARETYLAAKETIDALQSDEADIDLISDRLATKISSSRTSTASSSWFTHFGSIDKSGITLVKEALKPRENYFLKTGIDAFDDINSGIPRGSFFLIASTTSGGKSIMVGQLAENFALNGARVCIVPLEMDALEMTQRSIARNAGISIEKIVDARKLNKKEKDHIEDSMKKFDRRIKKVGGLLTFYVPEEDMTIEDILMATDPFDYDAIVIDYVALLKGSTGDDQWKALGNITRTAKRHATIRKRVVGLAAQLTDESVLKYSKTMAEHASNAWFWTRGQEELETKIIKVKQPKSRNQKSFDFYIGEDFEHMRFTNLATEELNEVKERINNKNNSNQDNKKKNRFKV